MVVPNPFQTAVERGYMKDYVPDLQANNMLTTDQRIAAALEYSAFQMGQINRKLDQLIEAAKLIAVKT